MNIRPVNARTLVRPLPKEDIQVGSLILPDGGNKDLIEAVATADFQIVDAAGVTVLVKKGEKVIYPSGAGLGHMVNGVHHQWVVITDIWAIIDDHDASVQSTDTGDNAEGGRVRDIRY